MRLGPWERAPGVGVAKNQPADRLERLLSEKDSRKVRSCNRHTTLQQCNSSFKDGRKIKSLFGILSMANSFCFRGVQVGHVCSLKPMEMNFL